jgi:hypothetical protein
MRPAQLGRSFRLQSILREGAKLPGRDPAVLRLLPIPLQATGAVRCWGGNLKGELGLGDTITRGDSKFPGHGDRPSILSGYGACQRVIDLDCGGSMRAL